MGHATTSCDPETAETVKKATLAEAREEEMGGVAEDTVQVKLHYLCARSEKPGADLTHAATAGST
eukprot:3395029-Rhodomonas_salina.4